MSHWGYHPGSIEPHRWHEIYPNASGRYQSPIEIDPTDVTSVCNGKCSKFIWNYNPEDLPTVLNTGHSWQVGSKGKCFLRGGPLQGEYELVNIHAHWGSNDNKGSEHTIKGKQFSAEIHLVHYNRTKYKNFEDALNYGDGLCVLAVLLQLGETNPELQKIVEVIPNILHAEDKVKLRCPINPKLLLPDDLQYYSYRGSLTTPPCTECVIWIVFKTTREISSEQLRAFRSLRTHTQDECEFTPCSGEMTMNFRPIVPRGKRKVFNSLSG